MRVIIGCCNYLFGEGLKKLLSDESDMNVIGIFNEGIDAREIAKLNPDLLLVDFSTFNNFPEDFIIEKLKILLIDDRSRHFITDERMLSLVPKSVVGILPPGTDYELLKKALKAVSSGELWIDRKTLKSVLSTMGLQERKAQLTAKEKEIVSLICQGYRNKEIAMKLDISEQTIKSHCNRIYKKLGISDRLQLAIYCYRNSRD
jgi:DNA-binding NarL/FixJ family response regulator